MADIKTTLRETGVLLGIWVQINNLQFPNNPSEYIAMASEFLSEEKENILLMKLFSQNTFSIEEKEILNNCFKLAKEIKDTFKIESISSLLWTGNETQKEIPYDIVINDYKFSLKEDSYILENMGLYKLLNFFTGSNYKTRHIFKDYAPVEYREWFNFTWNELQKYLANNSSWSSRIRNKKLKIEHKGEMTLLEGVCNGKAECKILPNNLTLEIYEKKTNSFIREEVYSKFINEELNRFKSYQEIKRRCSIVAANNLVQELKKKPNYKADLYKFLRIYDEEYYYAKISNGVAEIYKIPSLSEFTDEIEITDIRPEVPKSQVNIITTIKNKKSGNTLTFRSECRFSHGQFNGTPEAKLYIAKGQNLLAIYERIK